MLRESLADFLCMKHSCKIILTIFCSLLVNACANSGGIKVESTPPGADVEVIENGSVKKIGQTPLNIDKNQIDSSNAVQLSVSLKNHQTQKVLLPPTTLPRSGQLFFKMTEIQLPAACVNQEITLSRVSRGVAEAQSLIQGKDYDRAITLLSNLTTEFPNVSVLQDLLGNTYYLRKDLDRALAAYKRSVAIESNNPSATRMIQKIETLRGGAN